MKSLEEIIIEVGKATYVGQSAPVLEACRMLVVDGRFRETAELLKGWVEHAPESKRYVCHALPRIVLNSYLAPKNILTYEQFDRWAMTSDWSKLVRENALGYSLLPDAIAVVE
jgi:hypothetical protein